MTVMMIEGAIPAVGCQPLPSFRRSTCLGSTAQVPDLGTLEHLLIMERQAAALAFYARPQTLLLRILDSR